VLLLTSRQGVDLVTRHLWRTIDEVVLWPIEKVELQARVEVLLRTRQLSVALQRRNGEHDGGRVGMTSAPGQGSTFGIELPHMEVGREVPDHR
jgi:DNA-binding response OmpR family regulator